jgi:HD-like signal output (HDOD) protein
MSASVPTQFETGDPGVTITPTAVELVAGVTELVSLPQAYLRIRELVADPNVSLNAVASVVSADPSLAARVLRLANSAFFGLPLRIETVTRAVNMLGTRFIHDLSLATSAVRAFDGIPNDVMSMPKFWQRSIYAAVVARLLAKRHRGVEIERAFVAGLLHNLGHLVMYYKAPGQAFRSLARSTAESRALAEVEREIFGFDYAEVGCALLSAWKLPGSLQSVVGYHTRPSLNAQSPMETAIVHVASVVAIAADARDSVQEFVPEFDVGAFGLVNLTEDAVEPLMEEADQLAIDAVRLLTQ